MIHSLQQVRAKGLELLTKYGFDPEAYDEFECEVSLIEEHGVVRLQTTIMLKKKRQYIGFGRGVSPAFALQGFEEDLAKHTGKVLDDITFEVDQED